MKTIDINAIQTKVWLDDYEAAAYMGITSRQVHNMRIKGTQHAGTLPYSKLGKSVRIRRTNIDKFLEKHNVKTA